MYISPPNVLLPLPRFSSFSIKSCLSFPRALSLSIIPIFELATLELSVSKEARGLVVVCLLRALPLSLSTLVMVSGLWSQKGQMYIVQYLLVGDILVVVYYACHLPSLLHRVPLLVG
jgi:hypothetical protein